jgi:enamine deaminase RidA (YjgF/YER057c/UK114 family)
VKRVVATKQAAAMYNPVSQATLAPNGMLYTAGMIGRSPETGQMLPSFEAEPPARAVCQPLQLYPGALVMFTAVACVGTT